MSIGRALMNAPAVVLADEPTGNLDSKNSQEIVELLKMSNKKYGQTLVIITHDTQIAVTVRQQPDQFKLRRIRILVLIHHDVSKALLIVIEYLRTAF